MLYRRLYGVLDATGYRILISDTTNISPVLETVWISNIAAEIYHFGCKLLLVRNQLFRYLIVDMISSLSSLVRRFGCYRLCESCGWYHWRLSCTWKHMNRRYSGGVMISCLSIPKDTVMQICIDEIGYVVASPVRLFQRCNLQKHGITYHWRLYCPWNGSSTRHSGRVMISCLSIPEDTEISKLK